MVGLLPAGVSKRSKFGAWGLVLAAALLQLFFVRYYWNDKTSTAVSVVERMYAENSFVAPHLPCALKNGVGVKAAWAEEPPVYHAAGVALKTLGLTDAYAKVLPVLSTLLLILGLCALVSEAGLGNFSRYPPLLPLMAVTTPFLYIHFSRFLPDTLMAALVALFLLAWHRGERGRAYLWAVLAVTVKATAIFLVGSAWFAWALLSPLAWGRKFGWGFVLFTSILPMIAWLFYLQYLGIDNPFFAGSINFARHTGGGDLHVLFTLGYWSRFLTWVAALGVSIPLFVAFLFNLKSFGALDPYQKFLAITSFGILPYWLVVRGPQYSAPYYSFPFFVPIVAFALIGLSRAKSKYWLIAIAVFLVINAVPKVQYSTDLYPTIGAVEQRPIQLSCARQGIEP